MKNIMALAASASLALGAASAAPIVLDDFNQALATGVDFSGSNQSTSNSDILGIYTRTITVSSTVAQGDNIIIGGGAASINSGLGGVVDGEIKWAVTDPSGGAAFSSLGVFEVSLRNMAISSNANDVAFFLTLSSGIGTVGFETFTENFNLADGDEGISVLLSIFEAEGVDLSDIDEIILGYRSDQFEGADFILDGPVQIRQLPVPGALPLMLAGIGLYAARRRGREAAA